MPSPASRDNGAALLFRVPDRGRRADWIARFRAVPGLQMTRNEFFGQIDRATA